ncbi:OLC1v1030722C1 [Oldenlandia corymbosa var. corymbosa]|uniref:OLC1v1030722C1 n=1 Tax=Oldenlandia corymbosa var. corymbosa TaxID=529605 RepID=A0AAV1CK95_OLDCO|nr:OLC1v1030722C1 [Oldenlandia corymbosa var. corymbosa]
MAKVIGKPLKVDAPTLNLTRPSVPQFCVEVDLTKEFTKSVKLGKKGKKHEQLFTYEHVSAYCSNCCKIGHKAEDRKKGVAKKPAKQPKQKNASKESQPKHILKKPENPNLVQKVSNVVKANGSSGLTETDKEEPVTSVAATPLATEAATEIVTVEKAATVMTNRFDVLETITKVDTEEPQLEWIHEVENATVAMVESQSQAATPGIASKMVVFGAALDAAIVETEAATIEKGSDVLIKTIDADTEVHDGSPLLEENESSQLEEIEGPQVRNPSLAQRALTMLESGMLLLVGQYSDDGDVENIQKIWYLVTLSRKAGLKEMSKEMTRWCMNQRKGWF